MSNDTNSTETKSMVREDFLAEDYAPQPTEVDPVEEALNATYRGLPLSFSASAKAAAFRYGMNMMGLREEDYYANGSFPGMNDDATIAILCSLCAADAGKDEDCPEELKGLLLRRTLTFSRQQLAEALLRFVDAFDINPLEDEIYTIGFGLIGADSDSVPTPKKESTPGK